MKTILFVASEPEILDPTKCSMEHKHMQRVKLDTRFGEDYSVTYWDSVTPDDLLQLLKRCPNYIHYCGHGNKEGEAQVTRADGTVVSVSPEILAKYLRRNKKLECVVLCSCNSAILVEQIKGSSNCSIGFIGNVNNDDMHQFTADFYSELFTVGSPLHAYLNMIDKIRIRKPQGNFLIFRTKLNQVMESVLNKELTIAQATALEFRQDIGLTDDLLAAAQESMDTLEKGYELDLIRVMKTHPAPREVIWFNHAKEALAVEVAKILFRDKAESDIFEYAEEIKVLYFAFSYVLAFYEDEDGAIETFEGVLGTDYSTQDYINAISELRHIEFGCERSPAFDILFDKSITHSISIITNLTAGSIPQSL